MAKKSKSFNKHVYSLIAVIVLLVAAGIASYAVAPAGSATHGTLYTDDIYNKTDTKIEVFAPTWFWQGIGAFNGGFGGYGGAMGSPTEGVLGQNPGGSNVGKLGTATAGVEGNSNVQRGISGTSTSSQGVVGTSTNSYGVYGISSTASGIKGESTSRYGLEGQSTNSYGVMGTSTNNHGVYGTTWDATGTKYAGYFSGGKGVYASKISLGPDAFNAGDLGQFVIGNSWLKVCDTICQNHGMTCLRVFLVDGTLGICSVAPAKASTCWCGSPSS